MSSPTVPADAVPLAEQLVDLVKSIAEPPYNGELKNENVDPFLVWNTKIQIQNSCDRLLAKTMGPLEHTILLAESCQESQALHFVSSLGIADLIGDGQMTLATLSERAGVESQFLGVAMSCLLGRGYFEEVGKFGSRTYKNNDFSQVLREDHPLSLKKAVGFAGGEGFRAASYLLEAAKVAPVASEDLKQQERIPAVNLAFGFKNSIFEWMASPGQAWRGERMGQAMKQFDHMANANVSDDYPWNELSSPIVDVGGGFGSLEMSLLKSERYSHLEFIILDLPKTVEGATRVWNARPSVARERVSFVAGNFMAPTLDDSCIPQGKPTYIIRHVLHNWVDRDVVYILSMVRQAMPPTGRLLLVEMLLRPESSRFVRATSMQLLALGSGVTRTQDEVEALAHKAGFRIVKVTHMRAVDSIIEIALK